MLTACEGGRGADCFEGRKEGRKEEEEEEKDDDGCDDNDDDDDDNNNGDDAIRCTDGDGYDGVVGRKEGG